LLKNLRNRDFLDDTQVDYNTERVAKFGTMNLADLHSKSVIAVIGRRNSGKSTLVKDIILSRFKDIKEGIVCSGSEVASPFYDKFMPDSFFFCNEINESVFQGCINIAKMDPTVERLVVVDDQGFSDAQKKSQALRELIFNGRHYNIVVILVAQSPQSIGSPAIRNNIDYVFLTRENLLPSMEASFKFFFAIFPSFRDFKKACDEMKKVPYRCLVADLSSFGGLRDMVRYYKSSIH